jgi:hypothetical protein
MRAHDAALLREEIARRLADGQTPTQIVTALRCARQTVYRVRDDLSTGRDSRDRRLAPPASTAAVSPEHRQAILDVHAAHPTLAAHAIHYAIRRRLLRGELPAEPLPSVEAIRAILAVSASSSAPVSEPLTPHLDTIAPSSATHLYGDLLHATERAHLESTTTRGVLDAEISLLRLFIRRVLRSAVDSHDDPDLPPVSPARLHADLTDLVTTLVRAIRVQHQIAGQRDPELDRVLAAIGGDLALPVQTPPAAP